MELSFDGLRAMFQRIKALTQRYRSVRLRILVDRNGEVDDIDDLFLVQSCDVIERLNDGTHGTVNCLCLVDDLPLEDFESLPVELQFVTDRGELRLIRAMVEKVIRGASDGGLTVYQFHLVDPLNFLLGRQRDTVVGDRPATLTTFCDQLLNQLQQDCAPFGATFTWTWLVQQDRYPVREFWIQLDECVTTCLFRLWRRHGVSWFFRAHEGDDRIELVLFDDPATAFKANPAGEIRVHHRNNASESRDSILMFSEARRVTARSVKAGSFDYKPTAMLEAEASSKIQRSELSNRISNVLRVRAIDPPHAGDDVQEYERLTQTRMQRHDMDAAYVFGVSSAPELMIGAYTPVKNPPGRENEPEEARRYDFTFLRHQAESNVREIGDRVEKLMRSSERIEGWVPAPRLENSGDAEQSCMYLASFAGVLHGTPMVPLWNPDEHLPRLRSIAAEVAGAEGELVNIDEYGRLKVIIYGERNQRWTAWLRVSTFYAHDEAGALFPYPAGTVVRVEFENGDETRPFIADVAFSGRHRPPRFNDGGPLPGNRYLSGIHLHEHGTRNFGELVWDLTPGQSSVQLGSYYKDTRLWLGNIYGRRTDGQGQPMGEGAYLHTLGSGTFRTGGGMLLTAYGRKQDDGPALDCAEHQDQLKRGQALQQRLGEYAGQHQGLATDDKPQAKLLDDIKEIQGGSNTDPSGPGGKPTLNVTAPAGIAMSTEGTLVQSAQGNADTVAGKNLQLSSGEATVLNAKKGTSIFAHENGIRVIAHQGDLLMQSQHGATRIEAEGDMMLRAAGKLLLEAQNILIRNAAGTFISLEDAIATIGASGPMNVKTGGHNWSGPATQAANLPKFSAPAPVKLCKDCALKAAANASPVAMRKA